MLGKLSQVPDIPHDINLGRLHILWALVAFLTLEDFTKLFWR